MFDGCIFKGRRFVVPDCDDFVVEVSPDPFDYKFLDFYLCNKNYGQKMFMFSFAPYLDYLDDVDDFELRSYIFNDGLYDYIDYYLADVTSGSVSFPDYISLKEDPK